MKNLIRSLFPQWVVNYFYHLPLAILANIVYGSSTRELKVIGVTGTDGKTTTVNMIYQILKAAGKKVSMVSTINAYVAGKPYDTGFHVTSPDPFMVQRFARVAKDNGDEYLVLEVTSHALDQFRFWGIKFEVGVITNITHEHLDYHKKQENYFKTKLKLIKGSKYAVINRAIRGIRGIRVISFGLEKGDKKLNLKLRIPGAYNIENALATLAVTSVLGIKGDIARQSLEKFQNLTGRMEEVKNKRGIKIIIDFAHTPNGLEQGLKTLRSHLRSGKLISLVGCEGYRDVGKRAMMGEIAQRLSDVVIATAVDPRGQMEIINRQISKGAKKAGAVEGKNFYVIEDRQEAINFAINNLAKKGDVIGIFGKGHEQSMNLDGKKEILWSDKEAVKSVLEGRTL